MNMLDLKSREISQVTCQRIGLLRKSSGLSLSALARQIGLNARELERIERNQSDPSLRCVIRIAKAFGVDVLFLVAGVNSGKLPPDPAGWSRSEGAEEDHSFTKENAACR